MVDDERYRNRILSWLDEVDEEAESDPDDQANLLSDSASDAQSEHSDHDSASEQSAEEAEEIQQPIIRRGNVPFYLGKDGTTKWSIHCSRRNVRTRRENIVIHLPGVLQYARNSNTVIDCWNLYFTKEMIEKIVSYTNLYLAKLKEKYNRARDCNYTNFQEICALIGLLYLAGVKKSQHLNVKELWQDDGTTPECFRATMSYRRFYLLLRALRFDNVKDRQNRSQFDNLAAIRELFEEFVSNCQKAYRIGEYCTIDEMLDAFRGRCKFRQYIANKPAKYGIKIWALVDARIFYTYNLEIYAGKQPTGPHKLSNKVHDVVKRLATPILNSGRNITMDNYFTSIPMAEDLLKNHRTTIVGTLKKNKREIPPFFVQTKDRPVPSSVFGFGENCLLLSYVPKKNKNVLVLSTFHKQDEMVDVSEGVSKPELIMFYNMTKGGVDVVDELKTLYSVSRISNRWPLTIFFSLLNIGGINSQIIFRTNTDNVISRREFIKELALTLIRPHLVSRFSIKTLPQSIRNSIKKCAKLEIEPPQQEKVQGFCSICPRRKNRRTKKSCTLCSNLICNEHTMPVCTNCQDKVFHEE